MGNTPRGITYPDPSGVPSRATLQTLATTTDTAISNALNSAFQVGTASVTVNSAGEYVVTHSLGRTPAYIHAVAYTSTAWEFAIVGRTTTTLTVRLINATTRAAVPNTTVLLMWIAA